MLLLAYWVPLPLTELQLPTICTGCGKEPEGTLNQQKLASDSISSVLDCITAKLTGLLLRMKGSWYACSNKRIQLIFQITSALIVIRARIPKWKGNGVVRPVQDIIYRVGHRFLISHSLETLKKVLFCISLWRHTDRSNKPLLRGCGWKKWETLLTLPLNYKMTVANCVLKEFVLQNSHPDANLNFQSDTTSKNIQQDDPRDH